MNHLLTSELFKYLLGQTEPVVFLGNIIFAALGIFVVLLLGTNLRNPKSTGSPEKFSWNYLWCDNARRIYASAICVLISLRFAPEIFGWDITAWKAFCIGLAWDTITFIIKQKTSIFDPKPADK